MINEQKSIVSDWQKAIETDLYNVEEKLHDTVGSDVSNIYEISKHLLTSGGKRLRPALVILASLATDGTADQNRVISIASTVELIHMASLIHDDVIDSADYRRGNITSRVKWGNKLSILGGDYMIAKAFSLLTRDGDPRIMRVLSDMTIKMSESEGLQAQCEGNVEGWREFYWTIIENKTASFLSTCCRCGAILAGACKDEEEALSRYGMELGLAFQLTDDILDIAGDPKVTGKQIGGDLREGKVTLPVLLALDLLPDSDKTGVCEGIETGCLTDQEVESLCAMINSTQAVDMARDQARTCVEKAIFSLNALPSSPSKEHLTSLATQIVFRLS